MKIETSTAELPAFLASALVNGDMSGLEERDLPLLEKAQTYIEGWSISDVGDPFFRSYSLGPCFGFTGDVAEYKIWRYLQG